MENDPRTFSESGAGNDFIKLVGVGVAGAALMYLLDPRAGTRRQKRLRDRAVHLAHSGADFLGTARRDTANRVKGLAATTTGALRRETPDDRVLEERVRAELGRVVSHPGAIEVESAEGVVVLRGPVLEREHQPLLDCVANVRGVDVVEDQLEIHETAEGIPALQGESRRTGPRFELAQGNWAPAARLLTGLAGASLLSYGTRQRGFAGALCAAGGAALLARAMTNTGLARLTGTGGGRQSVDVQKTINIAAPLDSVFAFFTDWERWPEWMSHVREVTASGTPGTVGERTRWVVDGPAGTRVSWDAEITEFITNQLVSWRSVEGAAIRQAGTLRFDENEDGTIRVEVQMTYNPPGGAAGHAVAKLFGRDPRHQMNEDLVRLKTTIESGIPPHDAARP